MIALEKEIEKDFVKWVESQGGIAVKFTDPARRGAPDRIVLLPERECYFVEFKRPKGGVVSIHQEDYAFNLFERGFPVYLIDSKGKLERFKKYKTGPDKMLL